MKTKHIETITIPPLKGGKTIAKETKLFSWIDSDFKNYGADEPSAATSQMKVEVREMTEDATFKQMFSKDNLLTQDQIIYFIENFKNTLHKDWYTFFPFKSNDKVFVADVHVDDGGLGVHVHRFSCGYVWRAGGRHRIVIPQLDTKTLDPVSLSLSDSLTLRQKLEQYKKPDVKLESFAETAEYRLGELRGWNDAIDLISALDLK